MTETSRGAPGAVQAGSQGLKEAVPTVDVGREYEEPLWAKAPPRTLAVEGLPAVRAIDMTEYGGEGETAAEGGVRWAGGGGKEEAAGNRRSLGENRWLLDEAEGRSRCWLDTTEQQRCHANVFFFGVSKSGEKGKATEGKTNIIAGLSNIYILPMYI